MILTQLHNLRRSSQGIGTGSTVLLNSVIDQFVANPYAIDDVKFNGLSLVGGINIFY